MDGQFITNKDLILSDIINSVLPKCNNAYFLVGYFYFSGFSELCDSLKDINLKILVGLEVEKTIINGIKEVEELQATRKSRGETKLDFFKNLVSIFNDTNFFDTGEQIQKFKLFVEKLENGSLEIRKTVDPNHSKLYLFENKTDETICGTFPGTMITGSSNLSIAGLKNRLELNVILRDKCDYIEGKEVFDELWENAISLVDKENLDEFKIKVLSKIWLEKLYSPYTIYLRVLQEYFKIPYQEDILTPNEITDGSFSNLKYQIDAIRLALNSLKNHEGVIISDVVGLGKSIIGSTIARNLRLRCIIICPPHLKEQWEGYRDDFGFTGTIFSNGLLEEALSHYHSIVRKGEKFLIIVDEAHKFRNEFTRDYSRLHELCMGNKVMLLTATPFNNRPEDIYSLLKLFQIPNQSTLKTVNNLGSAFKSLINEYKELAEDQRNNKRPKAEIKENANKIAKRIRSIIAPLVIRRSRLDLEQIPEYRNDLKNQNITPIMPDAPIQLGYSLGNIQELYIRTLNLISPEEEYKNSVPETHFYEGSRYKPTLYITDDKQLREDLDKEIELKLGTNLGMLMGRQSNICSFMRRMLVRRFESSVAAFQKTLNSMILSGELMLKWIEKRNKVPIYKKGLLPDIDDFYNDNNDQIEIELSNIFENYESKGFFEIDLKYIKKDIYIKDIKNDLDLLKRIRREWFFNELNNTFSIKFDSKIENFETQLLKLIETDPKRKIIVFSEFADTANYLGDTLSKKGFKVFKYTSKDATKNNKNIIRYNFDASVKSIYQKNDYNILIATDAISEGYNLNRAGTIINYDIPYNPTRVIQRIGRINRINKKMFDHLFIYNYFPTDIGESETRTKQISTLKMSMIHAIMGEDTKALTDEEELNSYFKERYEAELSKSEAVSWDTKYRKLLFKEKDSQVYKDATSIPHRVRIARDIDKNGIILFGKNGNDFVFKLATDDINEPISLTAEQALELFEAPPEEKAYKTSDDFDKIYQFAKSYLYNSSEITENEKQKLEAYNKLKMWLKLKTLPQDFLNDLLFIIKNDALTGEEIRFINKQTRATASNLIKRISQDYIYRIINKINNIEDKEETIILSEQLNYHYGI